MGATPADIKSIFGKALDLPAPAERAAYLNEACGNNPRLRAEVESLLQAGQQAAGFFEGLGPSGATVASSRGTLFQAVRRTRPLATSQARPCPV
jgi:hypothetical protein